uniref:Uncharacterized protein n=1 Tax=Tetranychus urticae TaxID=32264 RepID=T1JQH4_TETUR
MFNKSFLIVLIISVALLTSGIDANPMRTSVSKACSSSSSEGTTLRVCITTRSENGQVVQKTRCESFNDGPEDCKEIQE